jgi:hypothetical protein
MWFPACRRCVEHVAIWDAGSLSAAVLVLAGAIAAIVVSVAAGNIAALLVLTGAICGAVFVTSILHARAGAACAPSCVSSRSAVRYDGWSGATSAFAFTSPTYAARFAEHNRANLVSVVPELRELLDAHDRQAVQTAADARPLSAWRIDLESAPSRVARRIVLARALDTITDDTSRASLVEVVCAQELAPLLGELASRPPHRRRQGLAEAVAATRVDNVPEPLRQAVLAALLAHQHSDRP